MGFRKILAGGLKRKTFHNYFLPLPCHSECNDEFAEVFLIFLQKIMFDLVDNNPELLKEFEVVASDRKYHWGKEQNE